MYLIRILKSMIYFKRFVFMRIRYDMKKLPNGHWCVFDIITGGIARYNGKDVIGLNIIETDHMVDRLNRIYRNNFSIILN